MAREKNEIYLTRNVFVAGGAPSVTYNPRDDRHLETEVRSYLGQPGKALSVSGPTKSGKTVLIERLLPRDEAIWMHGSDLSSAQAFWDRIVDWLDLYDMVEVSDQSGGQLGGQVQSTLGIPGLVSIGGSVGGHRAGSDAAKWARKRPLADVAREGLETVATPIVIDDFHYVPNPVKREIARAVKSVIPFTPVVLIAVPHQAFDAIRAEPDMSGRVWQLRIEHWTEDELCHISRTGFDALNVLDTDDGIGLRLAKASYGAPFLMQQLCYDLAVSGSVLKTLDTPTRITPPDQWDSFFHRVADRSVPAVFEKLQKGPNPRGQERIARVFKDGRTTDIYGAVLHAMAKTGPSPRVRYQDLVRVLESELIEAPRGQHVTSSLSQMAKIARDARGTGDAALDYTDDELHILDPFLMFYLRYGSWDVERAALG